MLIINNSDNDIKKLKGLHIFHAKVSNCSMRVRLTAEEKHIGWKSHEID
mgnify:CR=1 FL=1